MILRKGSVAAGRIAGSSPRSEERFGDAAGLALMGVNVVTLAPGARSAMRHWHSSSDEFVPIPEGRATVVADDGETGLLPGDLALWPAGIRNAHQILKRTGAPLRCLCAGTNRDRETLRYPDARQTLHWDRPDWRLVHDDGTLIGAGPE